MAISESLFKNLAIEQEVDSGDNSITYIGWAAIGSSTGDSVWAMVRITDSATGFSMKWADGDDEFDNEWDNRESLSYS